MTLKIGLDKSIVSSDLISFSILSQDDKDLLILKKMDLGRDELITLTDKFAENPNLDPKIVLEEDMPYTYGPTPKELLNVVKNLNQRKVSSMTKSIRLW